MLSANTEWRAGGRPNYPPDIYYDSFKINCVRIAKAGNDDEGYPEALLDIDEEGWFPLGVRASGFEVGVVDAATYAPRGTGGVDTRRSISQTDGQHCETRADDGENTGHGT